MEWAVVPLVWCSCVWDGRVEREVGLWERRGQVRVAYARKNIEAHSKHHAVAAFFAYFLRLLAKSKSPKANNLKIKNKRSVHSEPTACHVDTRYEFTLDVIETTF